MGALDTLKSDLDAGNTISMLHQCYGGQINRLRALVLDLEKQASEKDSRIAELEAKVATHAASVADGVGNG